MATVKPFRGLRPVPDKVAEVASPPYDVLSSTEARERAKDNPLSFLHVVKPEIDLDPAIDAHDPRVYKKGAENLERLRRKGVLIRDEKPCFYIYKLRMGSREQIGLVATASVDEYNNNIIKKHEFTRPDKEQDRVNHIDHLNAQTGPVFLTYRSNETVNSLMAEGMQKEPVYDFTGEYDVQHTLYVVDDAELIQAIAEAFSAIDALYVADGHHRSAAASRVQEARKAEIPNYSGEEEFNYFLTVIFPDAQMHILDYNRTVKDLAGLSQDSFLAAISESFTVQILEGDGEQAYAPQHFHTFGMYLSRKWYKLTAKENSYNRDDPIEQLDVSILQNNLLTPILNIKDPRTDDRINFVGGIRGLSELEKLVDSGAYAVAFSLYPTSIEQLLSVADAGKVMPPKSTWFEPKLRSGVVIHLLD